MNAEAFSNSSTPPLCHACDYIHLLHILFQKVAVNSDTPINSFRIADSAAPKTALCVNGFGAMPFPALSWRLPCIYVIALHCFAYSLRTSTALHSAGMKIDQLRRPTRRHMDAVEIGTEGYKASNLENPPFFPSTIEELAYDVAFTTKIALINRIKRIRVDIRLRLTSRDRYMLKWLLLTSINLLDDNDADSNVHIFIDKSPDVGRCQELLVDLIRNSTSILSSLASADMNEWPSSDEDVERKQFETIIREKKEQQDYLNKLSKVHISSISDVHLRDSDSILVIFNPDNMHSCEHPDLLEDVQALCFHAALRKIPVILINPQLMATGKKHYMTNYL